MSANAFEDLPQFGKVLAEYVWIGGAHTTGGFDMRCKTKTLDSAPNSPADLPEWNYDGSSTNQAPGDDSEVCLRPVAIYRDPFRKGDNILVMCDTYTPQGEPLPTNTRHNAKAIFDKNPKEEPWFGLEQEYTLFEKDGRTPLGWPANGYPGPQGPYYCSAGTDVSFGRNIADSHYKACVYAGINISGINAEVMPGQWEFQVGPTTGVASGDELWMARYLMIRVCEHFGVNVTFEPKPMAGDWNGAGCHTNFSTATMRAPGGYSEIIAACERLGKAHDKHIAAYGAGNEKRLTGLHETCSIDKFCYGVANRGASIRIPNAAQQNGCGYFEDRRPSSNMDPYIVTSMIFDTTTLQA